MAQFECGNKGQNGARVWLVSGTLASDRSVVARPPGLVVANCRRARRVPMNNMAMEVPFLTGTVCVEIHHGFIGRGIGRIPLYVRDEVVERRAGEADHAVQSGQANRRQTVEPCNWHRTIRSAIDVKYQTSCT